MMTLTEFEEAITSYRRVLNPDSVQSQICQSLMDRIEEVRGIGAPEGGKIGVRIFGTGDGSKIRKIFRGTWSPEEVAEIRSRDLPPAEMNEILNEKLTPEEAEEIRKADFQDLLAAGRQQEGIFYKVDPRQRPDDTWMVNIVRNLRGRLTGMSRLTKNIKMCTDDARLVDSHANYMNPERAWEIERDRLKNSMKGSLLTIWFSLAGAVSNDPDADIIVGMGNNPVTTSIAIDLQLTGPEALGRLISTGEDTMLCIDSPYLSREIERELEAVGALVRALKPLGVDPNNPFKPDSKKANLVNMKELMPDIENLLQALQVIEIKEDPEQRNNQLKILGGLMEKFRDPKHRRSQREELYQSAQRLIKLKITAERVRELEKYRDPLPVVIVKEKKEGDNPIGALGVSISSDTEWPGNTQKKLSMTMMVIQDLLNFRKWKEKLEKGIKDRLQLLFHGGISQITRRMPNGQQKTTTIAWLGASGTGKTPLAAGREFANVVWKLICDDQFRGYVDFAKKRFFLKPKERGFLFDKWDECLRIAKACGMAAGYAVQKALYPLTAVGFGFMEVIRKIKTGFGKKTDERFRRMLSTKEDYLEAFEERAKILKKRAEAEAKGEKNLPTVPLVCGPNGESLILGSDEEIYTNKEGGLTKFTNYTDPNARLLRLPEDCGEMIADALYNPNGVEPDVFMYGTNKTRGEMPIGMIPRSEQATARAVTLASLLFSEKGVGGRDDMKQKVIDWWATDPFNPNRQEYAECAQAVFEGAREIGKEVTHGFFSTRALFAELGVDEAKEGQFAVGFLAEKFRHDEGEWVQGPMGLMVPTFDTFKECLDECGVEVSKESYDNLFGIDRQWMTERFGTLRGFITDLVEKGDLDANSEMVQQFSRELDKMEEETKAYRAHLKAQRAEERQHGGTRALADGTAPEESAETNILAGQGLGDSDNKRG